METETEFGWYPNREPTGRRIYVHQDSFLALAKRSAYAADLVFNALAEATVAKILHHHLTQAIEFGTMDPSIARNVLVRVSERFGESLTSALRQLGYQPLENGGHDFYPVLGHDEHITAFCVEAGYFTFATGDKAADIMYAEKGSMHEERAAVRAGKGPRDLTWISGRHIALLDATSPIGSKAAAYYFVGSAQHTSLLADEVLERKRQAVSHVLSETEEIVRGNDTWKSPDEMHVLAELSSAYLGALSKGIFVDVQLTSSEVSSQIADCSCEYVGAC